MFLRHIHPKNMVMQKKMSIFALGVGGSALVACMLGMGSSNRGLQLGLTR